MSEKGGSPMTSVISVLWPYGLFMVASALLFLTWVLMRAAKLSDQMWEEQAARQDALREPWHE